MTSFAARSTSRERGLRGDEAGGGHGARSPTREPPSESAIMAYGGEVAGSARTYFIPSPFDPRLMPGSRRQWRKRGDGSRASLAGRVVDVGAYAEKLNGSRASRLRRSRSKRTFDKGAPR